MKFVPLLFVLLLFAGCSAVQVNYDYSKRTDFSNYDTYNYFLDMETGLSELDERRLLRVLDSTLQSKGLLLSEEPDVLVNIISEEFPDVPQNTLGVGIGGASGNAGGGISMGIPVSSSSRLRRMIQFDLVDSQKNALFWQAISESGFKPKSTPLEREELLRKIVGKVFSKYPPE